MAQTPNRSEGQDAAGRFYKPWHTLPSHSPRSARRVDAAGVRGVLGRAAACRTPRFRPFTDPLPNAFKAVSVEPPAVIPRTFLLLPGIGEKRERQLWRAGCHDWTSYLAQDPTPGVSRATKRGHADLLSVAQEAWDRGDHSALAGLVPAREHWRFHRDARRIGYLDIESTGADPRSTITVVGVHDGTTGHSEQLVAGHDLDHATLAALLERFDLLVTFNGAGFDLPMLRHHYPGAVPAVPHLDLRGPLLRLGYKGGLKRIEADLGLARPDDVVGIDGWEAVRLWRRYRQRDDEEALQTLLAYNREDIVNLEPLARFACAALYDTHCHYWGEAPTPLTWPGGSAPLQVPDEVQRLLDRLDGAVTLGHADTRGR